MKTFLILVILSIYINCFSQVIRSTNQLNKKKIRSSAPVLPVTTGADSSNNYQPRETATDRYLNGPTKKTTGNSDTSATKKTSNSSPFVGGIHAANNASKTFDTATTNRNKKVNNQVVLGQVITEAKDTTFNVNTISQGGVTTNSGAVDKSGQSQFGQTNWGDSRSTVGESQWTVPPPITASFNKEFPTSTNTTWTRSRLDTTLFSARYKSGAQWVTSNYNSLGQRIDMRTEYPLIYAPKAVSAYLSKQPVGFQAINIYKVQAQGKQDVYEIQTASGKRVYINEDGTAINY